MAGLADFLGQLFSPQPQQQVQAMPALSPEGQQATSNPIDTFNAQLTNIGTVNGGSSNPQGNQAASPQQPSNVPSPGVAQAGGAQPQPVGKSSLDNLKYLLPLLMGAGAMMQRPRQAGTSTGIGMGLTAAVPALLGVMQQDQEAEIQRQKLQQDYGIKQQEIGQKQQEIGQGQEKIAIDKQKVDHETAPAGIDIAASLRSNPEWEKNLLSPDIMKGLTKDEQLKAMDNTSKLVRSDASLEEKAQARMDRSQMWQQSLQARYDSLAQQRDMAQEKLALAKKNGEDASAYRAEMTDIKKRMADLDKEKIDAQKEAESAKVENNNIKNVQAARKEFDAHWWKNAGKKFEDMYDPETGKPKASGTSVAPAESTIEP